VDAEVAPRATEPCGSESKRRRSAIITGSGWMHHFEFEDTDNGVYGAERPGLDSAGSTSWYGVIGVEGKFHILEDIAPR